MADKNSLAAVTERLEELNAKEDRSMTEQMGMFALAKTRNELAAKASVYLNKRQIEGINMTKKLKNFKRE